jgi:EAL domain-containing protein (putative c-di-GMP-specific phosphodiesterase class I)
VLEKACRDAAEWCRDLGRAVSVAVNVSPRQLLSPRFTVLVADVLQRTGLAPNLLKIEVTEGSLVADVDLCRRVLQDLRALGVVLALDDFGTGYSALSYLQQFEFDILKLDQSFVRKAQPGTPAAALAASIISMAACLGMKTVGEGVETQDHVDMLKSNGCNLMQGYLFSSPIARAELMTLISADERWAAPLSHAA